MIQPNKHGVFPKPEAEYIRFASDNKKIPACEVEFWVLEIEPGQWISSCNYSFMCGDFQGMASPLCIRREGAYTSRNAALYAVLDIAVARFRALLANGPRGCQSQHQLDVAAKVLEQLEQYGNYETAAGQQALFA